MILWNALVMAFKQIGRNLGRSSLTTLGVLIGVAAVIAMVTLGAGATARVNADLSSLGHNLLFVVPGTEAHGGSSLAAAPAFSIEDVRALQGGISGIAAAAPSSSSGTVAVNGGETWRTMVTGTDDAYLEVLNWELDAGRVFSEGELRSGAAVCILGQTVRRELFGAQDPIGGTIRLSNVAFRVIGTLSPKGQSTFGQDQDDFALVPLLTFQRRIAGDRDVGIIFVSARPGSSTERVKADIEALMRSRRRIRSGDEPDFYVRDMKEIAEMVGGVTGVLTSLLAAIAAVSLLVGGIGIMNIMLVSVTERVREIGIRLAIGARARDVLLQFLVEAIVLSTLGGTVGIAVGLGGSYAITQKLGLPFVVDQGIVLLAFFFSAFVGIVFGFFPARKAARLNPIDALRHE